MVLKRKSISVVRIVSCFLLGYLYAPALFAQSTPSELAVLSISELSNLKLSTSGTDSSPPENRWIFSYYYRQARFSGYQNENSDIDNLDVLFDGNPANRTDDNFPVVPLKIEQQAHIFNLGYRLNSDSAVFVSLPYIRQTTDHISIIPGYDEFVINSSGIGDLVLSYSCVIWVSGSTRLSFDLGLSLPTGSIDETGDTPRAPGDQILPYTMQIGSGTYDIPFGLSLTDQKEHWMFALDLKGKVRTGENSRNYRLGNSIDVSVHAARQLGAHWEPYGELEYRYSDHIKGGDEELLVPAAFPYPAPITNPDYYGSRKVHLKGGIRFSPQSVRNGDVIYELYLSRPVYQSLNGVQVKERLDVFFGVSLNF